MCPGDNSATLSARYLNAQLSAMWQNAVECVGHEGKKTTVDLRSTEYDKHKYTRSLAQFHFAGTRSPRGSILKEKLFFDGTFGEPRLEFICNHEVALYLKLKKGHFNKVYPTKATVNGYKSNTRDNVIFEGLEVAFRLKFSRSNLSGKDSRIGNGSSLLIQMMILDFASAQMVLFKSGLPIDSTDSLEWYLKKYLAFLQNAGHHVRFDLPDFDDDQYKLKINYSLATRALEHEELCTNVAVHGISEAKINDFLRETWLDVVSKAQGSCGESPDRLSTCLTEIQSTWIGNLDSHFHLRFSPPRVKALCKHEVILYFTAAEVHFFGSEDFSCEPINSFVDWEFAFIVDVLEDKVGEASSLKLDLTTARFCQHLSTTLAQEIHIHFTHIINFLEDQYMELLAIYGMHCLYYPGGYRGDSEAPGFSDISEDESEWKRVEEVEDGGRSSGTIVWSETLKKMVLYGYDHMVAVSEASINALFHSLRKASLKSRGCLAEWLYKDKFRAEFSAIRVKLLSGDKALVTFTVDDGHITLKDKHRKYDFTSWTISYEVDIKMVDQIDLHCNEGWLTHFANSILGRHGHHETHSTVKHIILDFASAKYVYKHSSMPGIWNGGSLSAVDRLQSFIYYMRKYLDELSFSGHNIIHSTPIFPHTHQFGLTSASFQIVSKNIVTVANCMFNREAPVIMVLGMMCGRPLLSQPISWGHGWVIPWRQSRLLARLEMVNRRTTVVPRFPRENEEEWKVYLTTWDHHRYRKNKQCNWKKVENSNPGWLEYGWEHRDEWSYEHEGTREDASAYSVLCHTKNRLCIPTMYRPRSMEIILRGESVLRLKRKNDKENWSKRSSAKWSVKINVHSEPSGLRVAIADEVQPVFDKTESEGKWDINTHKLLQEHLPRVVDIKEVIQELKQVFEGAWDYSCAGLKSYSLTSPVFTQNGDLIVQLGDFTEASSTKTITSAATSASKRTLLDRVKGAVGYTAPHTPLLKSTDSYLTTSSASISPLLTPPAVDADYHPLLADGSDEHTTMELPKVLETKIKAEKRNKTGTSKYAPVPNMELSKVAPPVSRDERRAGSYPVGVLSAPGKGIKHLFCCSIRV
ncbi:hypothetical protein MVEN_01758100 [Mycena venus]|uniref:Uncharacterized protein n=1 Tax=Mycena venus TaxID=2733690 RepID=A0A8H6XLJ9_9AGAR|nr:hypothetical protein MVEN_01758100 [Mycena venus]